MRRAYRQATATACAEELNRSEVEDHVQVAMERVWRKIDTYDPAQARFSTWVATITRNIIRDSWRYQARRPSLVQRPAQATGSGDGLDLVVGLSRPGESETPEAAILLDEYVASLEAEAEREVVAAVLGLGYRIADIKAMRPDLRSRVDRWVRKARVYLTAALAEG
jgi:RNA polymerase sigma factor (sigma-70 family)